MQTQRSKPSLDERVAIGLIDKLNITLSKQSLDDDDPKAETQRYGFVKRDHLMNEQTNVVSKS